MTEEPFSNSDKKLSEIIKELTDILEKEGDLPVEGYFETMFSLCAVTLVKAKSPRAMVWDQYGKPLVFQKDYPEVDTVVIGEKYD